MPVKSARQRRLMHAAAKSGAKGAAIRKRTGVPLRVAREFVQTDPGGKLPERAKKRRAKR